MENQKNSLANVLLAVVVIAAVFLVGFLIFGNTEVGVSDNKPLTALQGGGNLSDENQNDLAKERTAFFAETEGLRQGIRQKWLELKRVMATKNPDAQTAEALQKDISKLTEEFDRKHLTFILKMKKINPNFGRMGFRGTEENDDDVSCPNYGRQYGHHMERHHGYGVQPGMMEPGYGMGLGRNGREPSKGEMGPRPNRLKTPLQENGARAVVENYLQSTRNPNLKLGKITEQDDAFEAEIVTKDGSLVDKLLVDKSTGYMHPAN
jgi:hypothetical protein